MNLKNAKHPVLYSALVALVLFTAWQLFKEHEARRDLQLQQAVQQQARDDLQKIDNAHQEATDALKAKVPAKATIESVITLAPSKIPGKLSVQPVNGANALVLTGDPQAGLQAIQQAEVNCQQSAIDLTAANGKVATYEKKTIPSLQKEVGDLRTLAIPRWTLTAGMSKAADGTYKPGALLDYRISKSWGLTAGAANNALFVGASIHFGKTPEAK